MSMPIKAEQLEEFAFELLGLTDQEFVDFVMAYLEDDISCLLPLLLRKTVTEWCQKQGGRG